MAPEDNPDDEHQPTKEEWEKYQLELRIKEMREYLVEHGDWDNFIAWCNNPRDYDLDDPKLQFEQELDRMAQTHFEKQLEGDA